MMKTILLAAAAAFAFATPALAHSGMMHDGCPPGQTFTAGDITVTGAFSRATLPNAKSAGGYMLIENAGTTPDHLIGATTEGARQSGVHEMKMDGDVMKMSEVPNGLEIPAGGSVTLEPGGSHVMMMGIVQPLRPNECLKLTLTFEKAGELPIVLSIGKPDAATAADVHAGHEMTPAN
jgi:periplasmic copper chaperone A